VYKIKKTGLVKETLGKLGDLTPGRLYHIASLNVINLAGKFIAKIKLVCKKKVLITEGYTPCWSDIKYEKIFGNC